MIIRDNKGNVITTTERAVEFIVREVFQINDQQAGELFKGGHANLSAFLRAVADRLAEIEYKYVDNSVIDTIYDVLDYKMNANLSNIENEVVGLNNDDYVVIKKDDNSYLVKVGDFISQIGNPSLFDTSLIDSPDITQEPVGLQNRIYLWRNPTSGETEEWYVNSNEGVLEWDKMGNISINFDNFYTKAQIDGKFSSMWDDVASALATRDDTLNKNVGGYSNTSPFNIFVNSEAHGVGYIKDSNFSKHFMPIPSYSLDGGSLLQNSYIYLPFVNKKINPGQNIPVTSADIGTVEAGSLFRYGLDTAKSIYYIFFDELNDIQENATWLVMVQSVTEYVGEDGGVSVYDKNGDFWQLTTGLFTIQKFYLDNGEIEFYIFGNNINGEGLSMLTLFADINTPLTYNEEHNGALVTVINRTSTY